MSWKTKIVKSFDENVTEQQIENGTHTINFCSWNRLRDYLAYAAGTTPDNVKGVRADEKGLEIILK